MAYRSGIFPWTVEPITWWSPDPRAIFELHQFHVPRSLRAVLRKGLFEISIDTAFDRVIRACAEPSEGRRNTWISPEFIQAYNRLYAAGYAHSIECWEGDSLVAGIYGVGIGGLFAGESMFHRVDNASKVALHHLVRHLQMRGYVLFDIQMLTPVTRQLGAIEITRREYLERLTTALGLVCSFR
jgi:leucyl/phenylalanyl-tRNA--protein transferase